MAAAAAKQKQKQRRLAEWYFVLLFHKIQLRPEHKTQSHIFSDWETIP